MDSSTREAVCRSGAVILAGGKSSRMGRDKALLDWKGKPVVSHIAEEMKKLTLHLAVNTNEPAAYRFLQLPLLPDRYLESGPLSGLETAFHHLSCEYLYIAACDMPLLRHQVYQQLFQQKKKHQAVIPVFEDQIHPLAGLYHKSVLPDLQFCLDKGEFKVKGLLDRVDTVYISSFPGMEKQELEKHFFNMNHPAQYERLARE